jgi:hypothetical protein
VGETAEEIAEAGNEVGGVRRGNDQGASRFQNPGSLAKEIIGASGMLDDLDGINDVKSSIGKWNHRVGFDRSAFDIAVLEFLGNNLTGKDDLGGIEGLVLRVAPDPLTHVAVSCSEIEDLRPFLDVRFE